MADYNIPHKAIQSYLAGSVVMGWQELLVFLRVWMFIHPKPGLL